MRIVVLLLLLLFIGGCAAKFEPLDVIEPTWSYTDDNPLPGQDLQQYGLFPLFSPKTP